MKRLVTVVLVLLMMLSATAQGESTVVISQTSTQGFEELKIGEQIRVKGDYMIEFTGVECFSDEYIQDGYAWSYLDSKEDGAKVQRQRWAVGVETPMRIYVTLTNLTLENMDMLPRVKCQIVYDNRCAVDTTTMQFNPNQTTEEGKTGYPSIAGVPLEPLMGTKFCFYIGAPFIIRDSNKPLVAQITIDGTTTYEVNLRDNLEILK